jgi:glutathione S-transferase
MESIRFVELADARAARGVRMVVAGVIASPWSEAAKGLFHVKQIPALAVRYRRGDAEMAAWTSTHNTPVVFHDDDPPRAGWAEILALAERLGGRAPLVPADAELRVRLHGLAHELAGEGGLGWCSRLIMIHGSISTGGARSFSLPIAEYLAAKYGYAGADIGAARARIAELLALFDRQLAAARAAGHAYLLGDRLSALDITLATFLAPLVGVSEADCPAMRPEARRAYSYLNEEMGSEVPPALAAHRAFVYHRHLPWPIVL